MTKKNMKSNKESAAPVKQKPTLQVIQGPDDTAEQAIARTAISPTAHAAASVYRFSPLASVDGFELPALQNEVGKQVRAVMDGDMSRPEAILSAQAHTLDAVFNALAQKSAVNLHAGYMQAADTYLRMALKAQSQCRTTLEALSEVKNPRHATFIKQANIANQQQVNNGTHPGTDQGTHQNNAPSSHEKSRRLTNELLLENQNETLDTGRTGKTIGTDSILEAVGTVNWA